MRILSVLFILVVPFFLSQPVFAEEFGDVVVKFVGASPAGSHGYCEYRFTVANASSTRREIRLSLPDASAPANPLREVARTVVVEPLSAIETTLYQPPLPVFAGSGVKVAIDGVEQELVVALSSFDHLESSRGSDRNQPDVLMSQWCQKNRFEDVAKAAFDESGDAALKVTTASSPVPVAQKTPMMSLNSTPFPVNQWSDNWLAYSSQDGIVVTAEEMREMPAGVQAALFRWVECGGCLTIFGNFESPRLAGISNETKDGVEFNRLGFGLCVHFRTLQPPDLSPVHWQFLRTAWLESRAPFINSKALEEAARAFPVVGSFRVPTRGLFLMMLLFVIVIGPVNLFVLSKLKKRIWLLATVPALAILASLAVSVYAMFSEGWKRHSRIEALTILDERTKQASTVGLAAYYSPLTPGGGLRFGAETEITPQLLGNYYSYYYRERIGTPRTVDWTAGQHFSNGWVTARVPAHFMVRKSESRRERLTVSRAADGGFEIVNGLGAKISNLWFADRDGRVHTASNVAAGARSSLKLTESKCEENLIEMRTMYTWDWVGSVYNCGTQPTRLLKPGTYLAQLEGCPFVEEGLENVTFRNHSSIVFGLTDGGRE